MQASAARSAPLSLPIRPTNRNSRLFSAEMRSRDHGSTGFGIVAIRRAENPLSTNFARMRSCRKVKVAFERAVRASRLRCTCRAARQYLCRLLRRSHWLARQRSESGLSLQGREPGKFVNPPLGQMLKKSWHVTTNRSSTPASAAKMAGDRICDQLCKWYTVCLVSFSAIQPLRQLYAAWL